MNHEPKILSVRERPGIAPLFISYLQDAWSEVPGVIYEDSVMHSFDANKPMPQWYLLMKDGEPIGCAGLVTNDFVSRMDLWPWLVALYIDPEHRSRGYAGLLIQRVVEDARDGGFENLYLTTDLEEFYERYGFRYIGDGYDVSGEPVRMFEREI